MRVSRRTGTENWCLSLLRNSLLDMARITKERSERLTLSAQKSSALHPSWMELQIVQISAKLNPTLEVANS